MYLLCYHEGMTEKRVVVTGVGSVSPNGLGNSAYKAALLSGKSGIRRISTFDPSAFPSRIAGTVELNGQALSEKERRHLPRVTQLALLAAQEAWETAGFASFSLSDELRNAFGVMVGSGGGSIEFMEKHYEMHFGQNQMKPSLYVIPSSTSGSISSEISIRLGLRGLSHVITTGCTSATDAIGYGFGQIKTGRLRCVIAGGADAPIVSGSMRGFCLLKVLSTKWNDTPEQASRPFSRDRDGFVLAEGSWMLVLEEYEHAKKRGAEILGEILGYGSSCEAFHSVRLDENGAGNFQAIRLAVDEAQIHPEMIDYVNLHGTSTVLNDRVETQAMKYFFGDRARKIPMSSTKSMIGHPQGASGAAGIVATLLLMQENLLHPTINLGEPDPECDLDYIPRTPREKKIHYSLCNTIGFGSKCSALILRKK